MTSPSLWELHVAKPAAKALDEVGSKDRSLLLSALEAMRIDPWSGDIVKLKGQPTAWRRRVGSWRILFDVHAPRRLVVIAAILRRTSTTY